MDKILIQGLKVNAILGIYERERNTPQPVSLDLTLFTEERDPGLADKIEDCVDYEKVSILVRNHVLDAKKLTVEALAEEIASLCLSIPKVREVIVRILKTNAINFTDGVGVEIHRLK